MSKQAQFKRQGDQLIAMLKKRGMTTLEMIQTGISVCPWKRVRECLAPGEVLDTSQRKGRHVVYRVAKTARGGA